MSTLQAFIHRIADKPFSETPIHPLGCLCVGTGAHRVSEKTNPLGLLFRPPVAVGQDGGEASSRSS